MTVAEVIFYILAVLVIVASIGVVTVPNVVHAALFLLLSLLGVAGFYILLSNEFLALVQILIYAGTVSVLVLLALMLTRGREQNLPSVGAGAQWPLALVATVVLVGVLLTAVLDVEWPRDDSVVTLIDINTLGGALFRDWLLPFELVSVVLTVALIGAVVLAHRDEEEA
jgi:NADH:ubiquinone oxidoreductase subunit 6 (subunit J)